jgi:hypothetical protein
MTVETKGKLVKVGKTIGIGLLGAVIAAGALVSIYFFKKGGGSSSSGGGDNS